jgi:two-component system chemotaxis sensor kinase CheA
MQDSYREIFLSESQEYLKNISNCLVKLEQKPSDLNSLNEIFRCTHTLKGMSATMGFEKITLLSHLMEDLLDELRSQKRTVTSGIIDSLLSSTDILEQLIQDVRLKQDSNINISLCLEGLKKLLSEDAVSPEEEITLADIDSIGLNEIGQNRLKQAKEKGLNVFKLKVLIDKNCAMKEARAFLVLTHLKRMGEVIQSVPAMEDLKKDRRMEQSFISAIFSTEEDQETVRQGLLNISEIEEVSLAPAEIQPAEAQAKPQPQEPSAYIKKIQSMRIPVQRLDKIMNLMGELTIAKIQLLQMVQSLKLTSLDEISTTLDRLTSTLQDEIMQTRLLPASYILDAFNRVVRDLSKKKNKEVDLEIIGGEIELDRIVLDEIGDPLIHLLRNAIDHGIETPRERIAGGKNPRGKILITVSRQKGQIYIEVADDGKGIDLGGVRRIALEKGLLTEDEAANLEEKKLLELITLPGFSTAKEVSDISGRGVGLDVVKIKIESLGGRVDCETKPRAGTRFLLTLPLTLAIIKAMLVRVQQETLAIPLMSIRETIKLRPNEIKRVQNFEVVKVRDEVIPILRMDRELGITVNAALQSNANELLPLVIIEYEKKSLGLVVTKIIGEQDIVVKPLPSFVKKTKGIAGATILGDGRVALILDSMSLR